MGWMQCIGYCIGCKRVFCFNPERVPSVIIEGTKEPICQACVDVANPKRIANGLEPIVPLPGAYEAAEDDDIQPDEDFFL